MPRLPAWRGSRGCGGTMRPRANRTQTVARTQTALEDGRMPPWCSVRLLRGVDRAGCQPPLLQTVALGVSRRRAPAARPAACPVRRAARRSRASLAVVPAACTAGACGGQTFRAATHPCTRRRRPSQAAQLSVQRVDQQECVPRARRRGGLCRSGPHTGEPPAGCSACCRAALPALRLSWPSAGLCPLLSSWAEHEEHGLSLLSSLAPTGPPETITMSPAVHDFVWAGPHRCHVRTGGSHTAAGCNCLPPWPLVTLLSIPSPPVLQGPAYHPNCLLQDWQRQLQGL